MPHVYMREGVEWVRVTFLADRLDQFYSESHDQSCGVGAREQCYGQGDVHVHVTFIVRHFLRIMSAALIWWFSIHHHIWHHKYNVLYLLYMPAHYQVSLLYCCETVVR